MHELGITIDQLVRLVVMYDTYMKKKVKEDRSLKVDRKRALVEEVKIPRGGGNNRYNSNPRGGYKNNSNHYSQPPHKKRNTYNNPQRSSGGPYDPLGPNRHKKNFRGGGGGNHYNRQSHNKWNNRYSQPRSHQGYGAGYEDSNFIPVPSKGGGGRDHQSQGRYYQHQNQWNSQESSYNQWYQPTHQGPSPYGPIGSSAPQPPYGAPTYTQQSSAYSQNGAGGATPTPSQPQSGAGAYSHPKTPAAPVYGTSGYNAAVSAHQPPAYGSAASWAPPPPGTAPPPADSQVSSYQHLSSYGTKSHQQQAVYPPMPPSQQHKQKM